jgi:DNA-binding transcriptional ArsR family regulator
MKKKIIIAPVNPETESSVLFSPIREFPTEKLILLAYPEGVVKAEGFREDLEKLSVPVSIVKVNPKDNIWEDFFSAVADVLEGQESEDVIINISTADRVSQCALTNAAHVNGIRAIAVIDGNIILLPILRLSYSNMLSDKKIRLLRKLSDAKCISSLEDLAKSTNMSLQLVSYHINGSERSKGLLELELVETEEQKGKIRVCLSTMGRLFMKGYISN